MKTRHFLWIVSAMLMITAILLTACGGATTPAPAGSDTSVTTPSGEGTEKSAEPAAEESAPTPTPAATLTPQERIPEFLVVHPDAFNFEITEASNTYVYIVPLMVADTVAYLEEGLKAAGWEELGKPTVMGHLATLNLKRAGYRLNVSMQDNERSMTTRVQMLLHKQ